MLGEDRVVVFGQEQRVTNLYSHKRYDEMFLVDTAGVRRRGRQWGVEKF